MCSYVQHNAQQPTTGEQTSQINSLRRIYRRDPYRNPFTRLSFFDHRWYSLSPRYGHRDSGLGLLRYHESGVITWEESRSIKVALSWPGVFHNRSLTVHLDNDLFRQRYSNRAKGIDRRAPIPRSRRRYLLFGEFYETSPFLDVFVRKVSKHSFVLIIILSPERSFWTWALSLHSLS